MSTQNPDHKSPRDDAPQTAFRKFALDRPPVRRGQAPGSPELGDELAAKEREARGRAARIRFAPLLRELDRRRAAIARTLLRERLGLLDPTALPARVTEQEWRDLWDAMEREVNGPQKGWTAGDGAAAGVEPGPEVAEWDKQWPSAEQPEPAPAPAVEADQPEGWRGPLLARLLKLSKWRR